MAPGLPTKPGALKMNRRVKFFKGLSRAVHAVSYGSGVICFVIVIYMILSTLIDVSMRYFFNRPIPGVIESNGILLPVFVFMGLAMTQIMGGHLRVTFLLDYLSPKTRAGLEAVSLFVCVVFIAVLGYETLQEALYSYSIREYYWGVIGTTIYIWPAKFGVTVGFWILCLQYSADFLGSLFRLAGWLPPEGVAN
jgi:TRAP-type C4-dicarboxylate transport system permease small subunit